MNAEDSSKEIIKEGVKTRSYLGSVFSCRCPRCREGKLFLDANPYHLKDVVTMPHECPVCKQPTEIEVGFYTGAAYVSYALTIALSTSTFVAWWVLLGIEGNKIWYWLIFNLLLVLFLTPVLMRWARSLWISWFVKYDPEWKVNPPDGYERIIDLGMEKNAGTK